MDLLLAVARVWGMHLADVRVGSAPGPDLPAEAMLIHAPGKVRVAYVCCPRVEFWASVHDGFAARIDHHRRGGHRGR